MNVPQQDAFTRGGRLRARIFIGGELAREDWLGGEDMMTGHALGQVHAELAALAGEQGLPWLVEIFDAEEPDQDQAYLRFGTDSDGMTAPMPAPPELFGGPN